MRGGVVASCYRNQDKLRPDGPLGSNADFTFTLILFTSSRCSCTFRSEPGLIILTMLKDAEIDVEKMRKEKLLPEDGKKRFIEYTLLKFKYTILYD